MKLSKETQREKKMTPWFTINPKSISFLSSFLLFSSWPNLSTHSSLTKENPTSTLSFLNETKTMKLETFFSPFPTRKCPLLFLFLLSFFPLRSQYLLPFYFPYIVANPLLCPPHGLLIVQMGEHAAWVT